MKRLNFLKSAALTVSTVLVLSSCGDKEEPKIEPKVPVLTTVEASAITTVSAVSGGNVTDDGGAEVTERGVCWGTAVNPTVNGSKTTDGKGTGSFTSNLTGLTSDTKYYVRAYATNSAGTAYGNELSFTTNAPVPDIKPENENTLAQTVFADEIAGKSGVTFVTTGAWTSSITEGTAKSTKAGTITWLSIAPDHGNAAGKYTIVIILEPNATGSDRIGIITITCNGTEITITVTQKGTKENGEPYVEGEFAGEGTAEKPYLIGTAAQLAKLAELVNAGNADYNDKHYKMTANINLGVSPYTDGKGWLPIGNSTTYSFRGTFDGADFIVSGININSTTNSNNGLFGWVYGGTIKKLGVTGINITGDNATGGIVGNLVYSANVINCYVTGTVSGNNNIGGVAGNVGVYLYGSGSIVNCYSTVTVSGNYNVGGVAGSVNQGSITNCYATGSVSSSNNTCVGGIIGYVINGSITNSYATGAASGRESVGGVVGYMYGSKAENCVALNPIIICTYWFGRVVGHFESGSTLNDNMAFSGMELHINNNDTEKNGEDINVAQAKTQNTYISKGWKFGTNDDNPWKMGVGAYQLPVFYWQTSAPAANLEYLVD